MVWSLINSYYIDHCLCQHQIDSYNNFIERSIQEIINNTGNIELLKNNIVEGCVEFGKISLDVPTNIETDGEAIHFSPHEARLRNLSYSSSLFIDIIYKSKNNVENFKKCFFGKIPTMLSLIHI